MISDNDLYTLSIFLGSCAMLLIVLYHFLEVNAAADDSSSSTTNISELHTDEKAGGVGSKPTRSDSRTSPGGTGTAGGGGGGGVGGRS